MDGILILQAILYFFIFIMGLITSISSGLARDNFDGECILHGSANVTQESVIVISGHPSVCTFLPSGSLIVGVLFGFCAFCYHVYYIHRSKLYNRAVYQMCLKALCFGACLALFVMIVAGGALTTGLSEWCDSVSKSAQSVQLDEITKDAEITCSDTQNPKLNWTLSDTGRQVYAGNYFYEYSLAQGTCWFGVLLWVCQLGLCIYRLYKKSKLHNTYQDPFVIDPNDTFS